MWKSQGQVKLREIVQSEKNDKLRREPSRLPTIQACQEEEVPMSEKERKRTVVCEEQG